MTEPHPKQTLMDQALSAFASMGDIFTDAFECRASVAAAQNLVSFANLLNWSPSLPSPIVATGTLLAKGAVVSTVSVAIDGSLTTDQAPETLPVEGPWALRTATGEEFRVEEFRVAMFEGDTPESNRWVVDDAQAFYRSLLRD